MSAGDGAAEVINRLRREAEPGARTAIIRSAGQRAATIAVDPWSDAIPFGRVTGYAVPIPPR